MTKVHNATRPKGDLAQKAHLAALNQANTLKIQMEILLQDHFLAMNIRTTIIIVVLATTLIISNMIYLLSSL